MVLDSDSVESTGLDDEDEVIELALVHSSGVVLFSSLIQPEDPQRPDLATDIHGISSEMFTSAPRFPDVWPTIAAILRRFRRVLVYNAAFDHRLLAATAGRYGSRLPGGQWTCLMEQYAVYSGTWSNPHHSYTWQSLAVACADLHVAVLGKAHRATADALAALGVLKTLAAIDGHIAPFPVPESAPAQDDTGACDDHPF